MKQLMWAALGLALLSVVMRIDYRNYREPAFIWSFLGVVTLALVAVLFMPAGEQCATAGSRSAGSAFSRRRQPSWRSSCSSPPCSSGAWTASTRCATRLCRLRVVLLGWVLLIVRSPTSAPRW